MTIKTQKANNIYSVYVFVLASSHLPVYLVAAFAKRLARLALTAPPTALLIVLPFIYNLIRRHPSCRVLIHKPSTEDGECQSRYCFWLEKVYNHSKHQGF